MTADNLILYTLLFTALACVVIPLLAPGKKSIGGLFFVCLVALTSSVVAGRSLSGSSVELTLSGGPVFGDIPLRIDALSAWFILIINLTCVTGAWYGIHYLKAYQAQQKNLSLHWPLFVVFQTSMLWVCSLQHGLAFLVAWEIMSISSFLLIMFDHSRISTHTAGINYLVQMHLGVAALAVAFLWISITQGSYDFNVIASFLRNEESIWPVLFLFAGFGIKAGFVPLHTWLPHAHPAAPSHVSGVMSGVIVKMGIYGIIRMITYMDTRLVVIGEGILLLSVATACYGILSAAIHRDIKRMLAFCTIENIGIIGMGIGIGLIGKGTGNTAIMLVGFSAALLHTLNHSLYKSLLFFAAGNVYRQTHTRNMELLGGLVKKMPVTAIFFLCGSLSISGLPPFNGFVSKFLLYQGLFDGIRSESFLLNVIMIGCIAMLAVVGGISIMTFTKSFSIIFLGSSRSKHRAHARERLSGEHLPFILILALMLVIGFFPAFMMTPVLHAVNCIDHTFPLNYAFPLDPMVSDVGMASLLLVFLAGLIYLIRYRVSRKIASTSSPTWGCGYVLPGARMQYTGKSFSKTLAKLFAFITMEEKKYNEIERDAVFPSGRAYQSTYPEFFEKRIINRVSNRLLNFMSYFSFIHNGRVQLYILYGFIFITVLIIASFFNIV